MRQGTTAEVRLDQGKATSSSAARTAILGLRSPRHPSCATFGCAGGPKARPWPWWVPASGEWRVRRPRRNPGKKGERRMRTIGTIEGVGGPLGFVRGVTRYQWLVFFVAWAGWSLDATDFGLFSLVLRPALTELLGGNPSLADIGRVGGILSMVGLLGWAFGGFMFGMIADYLGRVRTLAVSILTYSVFTALQGFAQSPLEFGIFRFLGGLGTGGEIIVGIPLVAEAFAQTYRARILGIMMTGGAFGSLIGGWVYGLVGNYALRFEGFSLGSLQLISVQQGGP